MGIEFRWYSGDSQVVPTGANPGRHSRWRLRLCLALAGLVFLMGGAYWQARSGVRAVRADLQRVIDQEILALRAGERESFLSLLDTRYGAWLRYHEENFTREAAWYAARPRVRAYVESVSLGPDLAVARVRLRDDRGAEARARDWHFRRVNGRWLHAPPTPLAPAVGGPRSPGPSAAELSRLPAGPP